MIRLLEREDLPAYMKLLSQLTVVGHHTMEELEERLTCVGRNPFHSIFVVTGASRDLIACATLLIEPKFIRGLSYLGHIEDVCVDSAYRGRGYGEMIVNYLVGVADSLGCYKVTLCCSDKNVPFYTKCGFEKAQRQMIVRSRL